MAWDRDAEERAALEEAAGLAFFCDAGIVALGNTLLGTLATFATVHADWRRALIGIVGADVAAGAVAEVEGLRARFRLDEPIGAVPHGGRLFGDVVADQNYQRRSLAVQLLGVTGRVVDAARGSDHCLVVLTAEHLDAVRLGLPATSLG